MKLKTYELKEDEKDYYLITASSSIMDYPLWLKKEINADDVIITSSDEDSSLGYVRERNQKHRKFFHADTLVLMKDGSVKIMVSDRFCKNYKERGNGLHV